MKNKTEFINDLKLEFEEDVVDLKEDTIFRNLDSWDSLTGMAIQVMLEDNYGVRIPDETFKSFKTINDIYEFVKNNQS
jgi:acyl carrier protein|tara:strand:+ start:3333 stop:3566 length:234 start_codon:yes stop_codon:yes gene_type:complete